jgi:iron complex transport system ATP-binding protein
LAILPQSSEVYPRLTVRELISFGRYPHHRGRPTDRDHEKVEEALTLFELRDFADRQLDTVSGGQRQRAHIAMTFVQDTDYILLDEPLNNLDIAASRALMRLVCEVAHRHQRTIVIVLHDINYACGYADHIVTLKNGRLGPAGPVDEVVTSDLMQSVFGTDARVYWIDGVPVVKV